MRPIAALALLLALASPAAGQGFVRGDANADGAFDLDDMLFLAVYLYADGTPPVTPDAADTNDNEIVNVTDFLLLNAYLFQQGAAPAAPYPVAGADPDDDIGPYGAVQPGFDARVVVEMISPTAIEMAIEIESPVPVTNLEVILELSPGFDGEAASFAANPGVVPSSSGRTIWASPFLYLSVPVTTGTFALPPDGRVGTLTVPHAGLPLACPAPGDIAWVPEATVAGILRRATIASDLFVDYHPSGTVDPCGSAAIIPWFRRGDCDGNAILDISDGVRAIDGLFHGAPIPCASACDGNDDGGYDSADAVWILHYLFAGGPSPPSPFPGCADDPTPDALPCAGDTSCP